MFAMLMNIEPSNRIPSRDGFNAFVETHMGQRVHELVAERLELSGVRRVMVGLALAKELRRSRPQTPVILTSGYNEAMAEGGHQGFAFLAKPYSAEQVCQLLEKVLGTARVSGAEPQ